MGSTGILFCPQVLRSSAHIVTGNRELRQSYHNVELQPISDVAVEHLFARFAWNLFPSISTFLQSSTSRSLLLRTKDGQIKQDVSGSQCREFTKVPSQASKKRSRLSELEPVSESKVERCEINSQTSDQDIDKIDTVEWRRYQHRPESWLQKGKGEVSSHRIEVR